MHVSLDSALGRQRRLNSVGESVLQIAPNAAAAYSLRSLTGGSPKVVRVRRASDNGERDFTSAEINSGEMVSWVNQQAIAPLDIQALEADGRTGDFLIAKAAYSLRSLGTRQATLAATGDTVARADGKFVAQVRRSSDDAVKSFTADEVTDGTLRNFCLNDDADIISFADAGLAGSPAANKRMYFDGDGDAVIIGNISSLKVDDFEVEAFINIPKFSDLTEFGAIYGSWSSGILFLVKANGTLDLWVKLPSGFQFKTSTASLPINSGYVKVLRNSTTGDITFSYKESAGNTYIQLGAVVSSTAGVPDYGSSNIRIGGDSGRNFKGILSNVTAFDGGVAIASWNGYGNTSADWTDQIGSSNGTVAGSSALFTGQGFDGFVKTWYDQSVTNEAGDTATGNHATQATAASQPKIVSAGALETDSSGNPALVGDGTDDTLFNATLTEQLDNSDFLVTAAYKDELAMGITGAVPRLYLRHTGMSYDTINTITYFAQTGRKILSFQVVGDTQEVFGNGTSLGTASQAQANIGQSMFNVMQAGSNVSSGPLMEVIVYNTNQSANRTALEANIGETYSITGIPAYDNEVDGFVETWYDQSGNGRDATQATAGSQPKIVDEGSYLGEVDFTSSSTTLGFSSIAFGTTYSFFLAAPGFSESNFKILSDGGAAPRIDYNFGAPDSIEIVDNNFGNKKFLTDNTFAQLDNLTSIINASTTTSVFFNGNASSTNTFTLPNANTYNTLGGQAAGAVFEVVLYGTDQTDNRVALETNINSQYSIF